LFALPLQATLVEVDFEAESVPEFGGWVHSKLTELSSSDVALYARLLRQEDDTRPVVVFVLGGPGAGKGTQCERIVREYGFTHISAGDCLREERASGSKDAELINNYIKEGKIVPVEITVKLLLKAMQGHDRVLIDGAVLKMCRAVAGRVHLRCTMLQPTVRLFFSFFLLLFFSYSV
jgi:hypothetical protein